MGRSVNAILAYGYDLGGEEFGWNIQELDADDEPTTTWWTNYISLADDLEGEDVAEHMTKALEDAGIDSVSVETYGTEDAYAYILAAHTIETHGVTTKKIGPGALANHVLNGSMDAKLIHACAVLGISPTQAHPSWLLTAYWDR